MTNNKITDKLLNWIYSKAISGFGGVDSAYQLANDYLKSEGTIEQKVDRLINWQVTKAATNGVLTGLGGIALMPVMLPANIVGVLYVQIRMISAIAYMGGHDIKSDQVKTLVFISMVGNGAKEILKDLGVKTGEKLLTEFLKNMSSKTLTTINERVGTNVASKMAGSSTSKFAKAIPLAGGLISGTFDAISTRIVGRVAKRIFITNGNNIQPYDIEEAEIL